MIVSMSSTFIARNKPSVTFQTVVNLLNFIRPLNVSLERYYRSIFSATVLTNVLLRVIHLHVRFVFCFTMLSKVFFVFKQFKTRTANVLTANLNHFVSLAFHLIKFLKIIRFFIVFLPS